MKNSSAIKPALSVMMFLQYAIWGAWLPILWPYLKGGLGFNSDQITNMFAIGAIGAIVAPFIAGQIADRFFATEKFLAISHLIGAVLIWQLGSLESYSSFLWFSLAYSIVYSPTLSLTNSLAFHHLEDRDRDFGKVRVWGTVGWIVVGIAVGQWLLHHHGEANLDAGRADAFRLSAVLGGLMGIFCLVLPHTPPSKQAQGNAFGAALGQVKSQPLITLFLISVPVSCIHQFYFVHTSGFLSEYQSGVADSLNRVFGVGGGGLMTIGQMTEIGVLACIPLVAKTVSRKSLLLVGLAAYAVRMALFAYVDVLPLPAMLTLILGVSMHGFCFGCFIFVAFMIVDEECRADIKASAQSLYNLVIIGLGVIVGSKIAGWTDDWAKGDSEKLDYADSAQTEALFSVPMWGALACIILLMLFYPRRSSSGGG